MRKYMLNHTLRKKAIAFAGIALMITPIVGFSEVLYLDKEIEVGNQLYTRIASDDCTKVKIWRKTVTNKSAKSINFTLALAIIKDSDKISTQVVFEEVGTREGKNICKQGGCYTKAEQAVSDAKGWLGNKCAFRNK